MFSPNHLAKGRLHFFKNVLTARNPTLLLRSVFVQPALLRSETRKLLDSLFQLPPRRPRL